ncbi:MAG: TIGR02757 family protein [Bacteroidota bacterium]
MSDDELKDFLEEKFRHYHQPAFIGHDPVSIPHRFSRKEDIEIAGFLAASIAWGQRPVIIRNATRLLELMEHAPYDFIMNAGPADLRPFERFIHRTFNGTDCVYFLRALKSIYRKGGLEKAFEGSSARDRIIRFRKRFFSLKHAARTRKHVSDPAANSSAKRLNMFLRWMVRSRKGGVDFGLWKDISPSELMCPLDVHSGNVARKLGLLNRKQNDWRAVEELTVRLREFDPADPVKYDFALFGLGAFEKF